MEVTEMGKIVVVNNVTLDGLLRAWAVPTKTPAADSSMAVGTSLRRPGARRDDGHVDGADPGHDRHLHRPRRGRGLILAGGPAQSAAVDKLLDAVDDPFQAEVDLFADAFDSGLLVFGG